MVAWVYETWSVHCHSKVWNISKESREACPKGKTRIIAFLIHFLLGINVQFHHILLGEEAKKIDLRLSAAFLHFCEVCARSIVETLGPLLAAGHWWGIRPRNLPETTWWSMPTWHLKHLKNCMIFTKPLLGKMLGNPPFFHWNKLLFLPSKKFGLYLPSPVA